MQKRSQLYHLSKVKVQIAAGLGLLLILTLLLTAAQATAALNFNDTAFATTWNRVDKPVAELPQPGRGYTWGPQAPGTGFVVNELYNGTLRRVQYFDKARMEVNDPTGNPSSLYYVTTGLLVKELVTGLRQDGDYAFTQLPSSSLQVAGDPNFDGTNLVAPTYGSFRAIGTFSGTENAAPHRVGTVITQRINRAGTVTDFKPPEQRVYTDYNYITNHNIADVFVNFANQSGLVWNGRDYVQDKIFFGNPTYVLGLPLTDPYWTRAGVNGVEKNVLVQLFERRVLTYTPGNPPGFEVEMGNVGQHYFFWRYVQNASAPGPAATITIPAKTTVTTMPLHIMAYTSQAGEIVDATLSWPDGTNLTHQFTTLRNSDGRGLLVANLDFPHEGPPPVPPSGPATLLLTTTNGRATSQQTFTILASSDPNVMMVRVYFVLTDTQLMAEYHNVVHTQAAGKATLEELLWGPSPRNLSGAVSAIPGPAEVLRYSGRQADWGPRVTLLGLTIDNNGLATANFSQELKAYGGGSLRVKEIRDQITTTLRQFPGINNVQIAIEGQILGVLEP